MFWRDKSLPERTQRRLPLSQNQDQRLSPRCRLDLCNVVYIPISGFTCEYWEFSGLDALASMSSKSGNEVKTGTGVASVCGTFRRAEDQGIQ